MRRGTLNEEERFKINEHIVQTLMMLTTLPLPKHLRRVPTIAGNHHEKMDGTGYPRRLTREQMSIPERVMAIADIFEALTAADRPYKPAKTLSESLKILAIMARDQHIDGELFRLFVSRGVYREYGAQFLDPKQLDEVDVEALLEMAEREWQSV
ncbi:Cyclic di-GMP phosphodiesterase response regulator RpfG [compost metagenome]